MQLVCDDVTVPVSGPGPDHLGSHSSTGARSQDGATLGTGSDGEGPRVPLGAGDVPLLDLCGRGHCEKLSSCLLMN